MDIMEKMIVEGEQAKRDHEMEVAALKERGGGEGKGRRRQLMDSRDIKPTFLSEEHMRSVTAFDNWKDKTVEWAGSQSRDYQIRMEWAGKEKTPISYGKKDHMALRHFFAEKEFNLTEDFDWDEIKNGIYKRLIHVLPEGSELYKMVKNVGKTAGHIGKGLEAWRCVVGRGHPYNTSSPVDIKKRIDNMKPASTWEQVSGKIVEFEALVREWETVRTSQDPQGVKYEYDQLDKKITIVELCPIDLQDI